MREKSKFITFLLSFIPGLSHLYLGYADRAVIFLMVFFGTLAISVGLVFLTHRYAFIVLAIIALPIIWLVALLDASSLRKSLSSKAYINNGNEVEYRKIEEIKNSNKKLITLALSAIPGAGHMYLGLQNKGLVLMAVFLFTVFFMGWLASSLFLFVLPLIWFYSFFDALHIVNGTKTDSGDFLAVFPKLKPEWVGWGLIGIGILVVVERIVYPLISYQLSNYIQTSIVSAIFIVGGIKLLIKGRANDNQEEGDDLCKGDE